MARLGILRMGLLRLGIGSEDDAAFEGVPAFTVSSTQRIKQTNSLAVTAVRFTDKDQPVIAFTTNSEPL